jgi:hypothetical protein
VVREGSVNSWVFSLQVWITHALRCLYRGLQTFGVIFGNRYFALAPRGWQLWRAHSLKLRGISGSLVLGACKIVLAGKRHIPRLRSYRDEGFGSV